MRRFVLIVICSVLVLSATTAGASSPMDTITITVRKIGSDATIYEFRDDVSGRLFTETVTDTGVQIQLQSNKTLDDGYGHFSYRVQGNRAWTGVELMRHGETHTLS